VVGIAGGLSPTRKLFGVSNGGEAEFDCVPGSGSLKETAKATADPSTRPRGGIRSG
jgi:hypothetical protein